MPHIKIFKCTLDIVMISSIITSTTSLRRSFLSSLVVSFSLLILIKCIKKFKIILDYIHSSRIVSMLLLELIFLFPYLLRKYDGQIPRNEEQAGRIWIYKKKGRKRKGGNSKWWFLHQKVHISYEHNRRSDQIGEGKSIFNLRQEQRE